MVDNGASSFVPVSQYLLENDVVGMMVAEARQPVVHTVINGGPAMLQVTAGRLPDVTVANGVLKIAPLEKAAAP